MSHPCHQGWGELPVAVVILRGNTELIIDVEPCGKFMEARLDLVSLVSVKSRVLLNASVILCKTNSKRSINDLLVMAYCICDAVGVKITTTECEIARLP